MHFSILVPVRLGAFVVFAIFILYLVLILLRQLIVSDGLVVLGEILENLEIFSITRYYTLYIQLYY